MKETFTTHTCSRWLFVQTKGKDTLGPGVCFAKFPAPSCDELISRLCQHLTCTQPTSSPLTVLPGVWVTWACCGLRAPGGHCSLKASQWGSLPERSDLSGSEEKAASWALQTLTFLFLIHGVGQVPPGFFLSVPWLGIFLRQSTWAVVELSWFVTTLSLLMSSVLKTVVSYVLSVLFFGGFRQKGTSPSYTLPRPEARCLLNPSTLLL